MIVRGALLLAGVGVALVGVVDLLGDGWADVGHTAVWLVAGVVAHDVLLSAVVLLVGAGVGWLLPRPAVAPVAVGLVLLTTVSLAVLPTLMQVGAERYNQSLLDRPYTANWVGFALAVAVSVLVATAARTVVRRRHGRTGD